MYDTTLDAVEESARQAPGRQTRGPDPSIELRGRAYRNVPPSGGRPELMANDSDMTRSRVIRPHFFYHLTCEVTQAGRDGTNR